MDYYRLHVVWLLWVDYGRMFLALRHELVGTFTGANTSKLTCPPTLIKNTSKQRLNFKSAISAIVRGHKSGSRVFGTMKRLWPPDAEYEDGIEDVIRARSSYIAYLVGAGLYVPTMRAVAER